MEEREERIMERAPEHKEYLARKQAREEREAMMTTEERVEERKKYEARRKAREEREHKKLEVWDCPRCNKNGHMLKHCPRPKTKKELREDDRLKNETRHQTRAQAKLEDLECASQSTASTAQTATLATDYEEEVRCQVEADKDVRRLAKKLREIVKLEACNSLYPKQTAKLEQKSDVEVELDTVRGQARARARQELFASR